jgi:hypothetical protein
MRSETVYNAEYHNFLFFTRYYYDDEMEEEEMGETFSMHYVMVDNYNIVVET